MNQEKSGSIVWQGYLWISGIIVALILALPLAKNIAEFWIATIQWASGISLWLEIVYWFLLAISLPGIAIMSGKTLTSGLKGLEGRLLLYLSSKREVAKHKG